ncbi:competence/damage-inducible protein A [Candidatus Tokpelaia sp.]|uniref:competence/damage-inducible protein A n=1 Tax=Candidatus Tokpelaia sp. TaxID=2233777 RepID=UPI00123A22EF|nr:molybdopterin-binding protein [Candidatus Tokpelaia sp.]KAA6404985.1 competence/damage-inducible protein A [Candidatus Tokpelaia sp.]
MPVSPPIITAAILAIGDELLSGRTKDKNIAYLAERLTECGIDLREVRIIPDMEQAIIAAINALRQSYHYVFTSGGIGPTHDDIMAESVAKAFGRLCLFDPRAEKILSAYYQAQKQELTAGRRLMTRMPEGAELIANTISGAPGFKIENCFIMAGVPQIFQAMVQEILPLLEKSAPVQTIIIPCPLGESRISKKLGEIQHAFPQIAIGSYPQICDKAGQRWRLEIVLRGRDHEALAQAAAAVKKMLADFEEET